MRQRLVQVIKSSVYEGLQVWKLGMILYCIEFGLAFTLGIQAYKVLDASIGSSLELNKLLQGYEHTVITDFIKVHGASITPLLGQLRWLLLIWWAFSLFLHAGLLSILHKHTREKEIQSFWVGAAQHFFPFLKINLVFLVCLLLWSLILLIPLSWLETALAYFRNESTVVFAVIALLILFFTGVISLYLCSVLARYAYLDGSRTVVGSIRKGWNVWRQHSGRLFLLFLIFLTVWGIVFWIFNSLTCRINAYSLIMVLALFLAQQGFVFSRILLRIMLLAGIRRISLQ